MPRQPHPSTPYSARYLADGMRRKTNVSLLKTLTFSTLSTESGEFALERSATPGKMACVFNADLYPR